MGIFINGRSINFIRRNDRNIVQVYSNGRLVWQNDALIETPSCFAKGYWSDNDPWTDDLPWKD